MVPSSLVDLIRVSVRPVGILGIAAAFNIGGVLCAAGPGDRLAGARREPQRPVSLAFASFPLAFEANAGQTDARVRFFARGEGYALFLTSTEAVFSLRTPGTGPSAVLRMRLAGARPASRIEGVSPLPGKINYFKGDAKQWRTGIDAFRRVRYAAVYPGIDLEYYGKQRQLEYDFIVAPGADPRNIRIELEGVSRRRLDSRGDLVLDVGGEEVRQRRPFAYQDVSSGRRQIAASYKLHRDGTVGFDVGRYDVSAPLVIDPVLVYSSYLGGSLPGAVFGGDQGWDIAVDPEGSAYITGAALSPDFPVTAGAFQSTLSGQSDAFVSKVSADGSTLVYSTFLGGPDSENSFGVGGTPGIAVDASGHAYVTGQTFSSDGFPTTEGAFRRSLPGWAVFVTKLAPTGSALVYSTLIGPGRGDAIAVDSAGHAYVTGGLDAADFPTRNALQPTLSSAGAFVLKLNRDGSDLVYSTYFGGTAGPQLHEFDQDYGTAIAVDALGHAYVGGRARSRDFPAINALQPNHGGSTIDGFVAKIDASGRFLHYSSFLGGSGRDTIQGLAVDAASSVRVAGATNSTDFPTVNAAQPNSGGDFDAFVGRLSATGSLLLYSTYLGGSAADTASGIALDPQGNAYVTGQTDSADFPLVRPLDPSLGTGRGGDAFVTKLPFWGSVPLYSTYLGGDSLDGGAAIAVDASGNAYITGSTFMGETGTFPVVNAFQPQPGGGIDAFVSKISHDRDADCHELADDVQVFRLGVQPVWFTPLRFEWVLIRNISADPIASPLALVIDDLQNAAFIGSALRTSCLSAGGDPFTIVFVDRDGVLSPDESALAGLWFWKTRLGPIAYTPRVLSGVPSR